MVLILFHAIVNVPVVALLFLLSTITALLFAPLKNSHYLSAANEKPTAIDNSLVAKVFLNYIQSSLSERLQSCTFLAG